MGYSCGDFSFLGGRGNSVIDYCVCSQSFLSFVDDFAVLSKPFSDHMPLNVNLKVFLIIQMSMVYVEYIRWNNRNNGRPKQSLLHH